MPRILATADIHFNHPRSQPLVEDLARQMLAAGGDILLFVGDSAVTDSDWLERCLGMFPFAGPRLFVTGNHELWLRPEPKDEGGRMKDEPGGEPASSSSSIPHPSSLRVAPSYRLYHDELPRRVRAAGFQFLDADPYITDALAVVGSIGWYDYSFAPAALGIPRRFYEAKVAPGAAGRLREYSHLLAGTPAVPTKAMEVVARWNDSQFVRLGRSDEEFLDELLATLRRHLDLARPSRHCVAAIHHLPFAEMLPPPHSGSWDFAKAFLGSARIGELLLEYLNVHTVLCGHSHLPGERKIGHIQAINIGSGYRNKIFRQIEIPD